MLANEGLLSVLRREINFDRDQTTAAINQSTGCDQVFGHLWLTEYETKLFNTQVQCYMTLLNVTFKIPNTSG
jgi:hypothetical protein